MSGKAQLAIIAAGVPRFALTREEAAESIGMSVDSFERQSSPS